MTTATINHNNSGAAMSASGLLAQASRALELQAMSASGKRRQLLLLLCERLRDAVPMVRKLESAC